MREEGARCATLYVCAQGRAKFKKKKAITRGTWSRADYCFLFISLFFQHYFAYETSLEKRGRMHDIASVALALA